MLHIAKEQLPFGRGHKAPAYAVEQLKARGLLQLQDAAADRRLGDLQQVRGA
ncbi:hypothetical protein D3C78_1929980 [compost metagenome]